MSLPDIYFFSFYLQMASYILPLWVGYRHWTYFDPLLRIFFLSVIISCLVDCTSWVLVQFSLHNHYLDYVFSLNSFLTKILIFKGFIQNENHRKIAFFSAVVILFLFGIDFFWGAGAGHHNAFSGTTANIWIALVTIYGMRQLILTTNSALNQQPFFWIFLGILIKRIFTLPDSLFSDYILTISVSAAYLLYSFTYLISVVENVLYARGLHYAKK